MRKEKVNEAVEHLCHLEGMKQEGKTPQMTNTHINYNLNP